jgi:choline-sulfatase
MLRQVPMRAFPAWIASFAVVATLSPAQVTTGSLPSPDVYLVTIDTLRADHVHCYGDDRIQTPALDSLARDGIRFAQAFTPSPITNTAHTSILTGLLPSVHGVTDFAIPLAKTYPTWAELLKQNGYQTAAFIGAVVLDSRTLAPGLDRGFDYYDNFPSESGEAKHWGRVERRGDDVVHRAEAWMGAHPQKPRFVWVHLYDPHDPYEPPPPYSQIYKDRLYDGEIAYADAALGKLLSYLKREQRYRNALIVVVGDHGEGLGEHGEQTHGIFLYDSTTHVPLLIKLPVSGEPASLAREGKVVEAQVETTDILPTVLDLLSIPPSSSFNGRSLRGYFKESKENGSVVFAETDYPLSFGWAPLRAVREGGFKFIEAPRPELYDLVTDPAELTNEYEPWNETVKHLRTELASSPMRPPHLSSSTGTAGSATLSELRALGYLGPGDKQTSTNVPEFSSLPDPKDKIEEQNLLHSAMMSVDQGRSSDARLSLQKVLQLNPDSPAALRQLGELEFNSGDYRKAADHLERARKAHPDDALAALYEGQALERLGDLQGARKALEAAVTQSPEKLDARLLLAHIDLKSGDRAAAEDQFEAVLLLNPANRDAMLSLAEEHLEDRRYADVVELLEPRVKDASVSVDELQLLIQAYVGLGRTADANKVRAQMETLRHRR